MKGNHNILQWMTESMDLPGEPIPGQPLVEISGCSRVLIENHGGVREYCRERIVVLVKYGCVEICGSCLELTKMTKEQLIISGEIYAVTLHRRGMP